ncbi:hypothetical protein NH26_23770 [Flammeovirga pacifica]|uniref:Uncharacterized protein n=2 Tax=Flammeovirga pacifica TaxID=915059 RepID=A0A1S1YUQ5_FLAPC|nr:hypothetical protein NH26_23770 [Flammeovirga pacifica]
MLTSCVEDKDEYHQLLNSALTLYENAEYEKCIQVLDKSINTYPDSVLPYNEKVTLLIELKNYDELDKTLDLMLENNISRQTAYFLKGVLLEKKEKTDLAYEHYFLSYQAAREYIVSDEQKAIDYILYLKLIHKEDSVKYMIESVLHQYPNSQLIETFTQLLEDTDIELYKEKWINFDS